MVPRFAHRVLLVAVPGTAGRRWLLPGLLMLLLAAAIFQNASPPLLAAPLRAGQTVVMVTTITIPTHPVDNALTYQVNSTYNIPYARLDRDRYNAGRVENRTYNLIILENDYLKLTFLPELGGRLYQAIFKPTGNNMFYQNPVLKPSPWGPPEMGWWLAVGGLEWGLPVEEHGYEWGIPWSYRLVYLPDGAGVELWDTTANDRLRAKITVILPDGAAYFEIRPTLENPTARPVDYKFWLNAMLAPGPANTVGPDLRIIMPTSQVTVHSTGDRRLPGPWAAAGWPVHNGVDWSRLGNWREWYGFFQRPRAAGDFQAVYDEAVDEGVVRTYDSQVVQGAKFFAFGSGSAAISPDLYTDDSSSYVEIHGGVGPTFADTRRLEAGASLSWTERWYPVAGLGSLTWANDQVALAINTSAAETRLHLAVTRPGGDGRVLLLRRTTNEILFEARGLTFQPGQPYTSPPLPSLDPASLAVLVYSGDALLGAYQYAGGTPVTPGPTPTWQGRLLRTTPISGWSSIVRIWVRNQVGLPVTLATWDGSWRTTGKVGTKPEYGSDALEFAPLPPGVFVITPQGLGTSFRLELPASTLAEVLFEPGTGSVATPTPTRPATATPTRSPTPTLPATATPTPTPLPTPPPVSAWVGRVRRTVPVNGWSAIARIWTAGRAHLAVTIASSNPRWTWQATGYSGSKAEYGPDALEFAPLPPGAYVITVPELNARFDCELPAAAITEIVFEPAASPTATPPNTITPTTPTATFTSTPPLPPPTATTTFTPTPQPLPTATTTFTPTPLPLPTATATATASPTASPVPGPGWHVRIPTNTTVPGNWFAVIRVKVAGKVGWPVRITIITTDPKPWSTTCRTGTKPEYGPDYCEFAPLVPASYTIAPEGLGIDTTVAVGRGGVAEVIFEEY